MPPGSSLLSAEALAGALRRVRESGDKTLLRRSAGGRLHELSPKFDKIVESLLALRGARGTALVYSEFRNGEGVEMLAAALEANGLERVRSEREQSGAVGGAGRRLGVVEREGGRGRRAAQGSGER